MEMEMVPTDRRPEEEWGEVFERLEAGDGTQDGQVACAELLEWLDTLNFQDSVTLEARHGIPRKQLRHMLSRADKDSSGFLSKDEFLWMVSQHSNHLDRVQASKLQQYLRVAAYADQYRWWPPPLFSMTMMVLMTIVQAHHYILLSSQDLPLPPAPMCSPFILHPGLRVQVWRFLTYSFVHATNLQHILVNLALLLIVGIPLEMTQGSIRVGLLYTVAVLAASLAHSFFHPGTFLAGASGGVYSLATAHIASILLNWREDSLVLRQRLRSRQSVAPTFGKVVRLGRLLLVGAILGVDILTSLLSQSGAVSHTAHISGAVVGVLLGLVIVRNRRVEHWETWVKTVSMCLAAVLLLLLIFMNSLAGFVLPQNWQPEHYYNLTECDLCVNFRRLC